jgi:hypothetical protein
MNFWQVFAAAFAACSASVCSKPTFPPHSSDIARSVFTIVPERQEAHRKVLFPELFERVKQ